MKKLFSFVTAMMLTMMVSSGTSPVIAQEGGDPLCDSMLDTMEMVCDASIEAARAHQADPSEANRVRASNLVQSCSAHTFSYNVTCLLPE